MVLVFWGTGRDACEIFTVYHAREGLSHHLPLDCRLMCDRCHLFFPVGSLKNKASAMKHAQSMHIRCLKPTRNTKKCRLGQENLVGWSTACRLVGTIGIKSQLTSNRETYSFHSFFISTKNVAKKYACKAGTAGLSTEPFGTPAMPEGAPSDVFLTDGKEVPLSCPYEAIAPSGKARIPESFMPRPCCSCAACQHSQHILPWRFPSTRSCITQLTAQQTGRSVQWTNIYWL